MNIQPYYFQEPIPDIVFSYIASNKGKHPLVALPTGSGKTVCITDIAEQAVKRYNVDVLILSHVKEILEQDYGTILKHTDIEDIGLYSSGLSSKTIGRITVAGIQSVYRRPQLFHSKKLVIIDEGHLIPPGDNGMYHKFFAELNNPVYLGFTATKYRLGTGLIYGQEDTLFDDIVYDYTEYEKFNELVDRGYLSKLKTLRTDLQLDVEGIKTRGGDFIETDMSLKFDRDYITDAAVNEIIKVGEKYKKWLIFAIDIEHAEHIAETLIRSGIPTGVVHSKMESDRDRAIKLFKNGTYKCLVNVNILTTGFDDPEIDLICILRPTKSPVLHVQMIGRGLRISQGKDHCMVLDFAGNTARIGPINAIEVANKRKKDGNGEPITKECPDCHLIHHPRVKFCSCGYEFHFKHGLSGSTDAPIIERGEYWADVSEIKYSKHEKRNSPPSLLVSYITTGNTVIKDWIHFEHTGYAHHMAVHWLSRRLSKDDYPFEKGHRITVDDVLSISDKLKSPSKILVNSGKKYTTVIDYTFS